MQKLTIDRPALLQLLQDLIRIDSVNPSLVPGGSGEAEIAAYIGSFLNELGLEVSYQELQPGRTNVIGILRGQGGGKSIMLNGHMDTVSKAGMDIPPLEPCFEQGRVYGRGSIDMKSGLAAIFGAVKALAETKTVLKGDVLVTCVADEEYASIGTEAVVKEFTADAAIVCEPSNLEIGIGHKGYVWAKIEVFGKAAHGSKPDQGVDAIMKAGKVLVGLEALGNKLREKRHVLLGSPSLHASIIQGGTELSTYPDYCRIDLERRTIVGEDRATVQEELSALLAEAQSQDPALKTKLDVFFHRPPLEVDRDEPIVQTLAQNLLRLQKKEPAYCAFSGWLDSALLASAGIPTVIFGPIGEGLHAATEYVEFDSVVDAAEALAHTVRDFCR
jgi:acetylornithine deacetylase